MSATETHQAIETVFRIEQAWLITGLARIGRDVGLADELAQDAVVTALSRMAEDRNPQQPRVWLMAVAKRWAIDKLRRLRHPR
jgi:predicted RNA polymerase sigma factor